MRRCAALLVLIVSLSLAANAPACGFCIEDRIAATYDHGVVEKARAAGHDVLFLTLEGNGLAAPHGERTLRRVIHATPGVDRSTIRVSRSLAAASFAWDAKSHPVTSVVSGINKRLAASGMQIVPLRVASEMSF